MLGKSLVMLPPVDGSGPVSASTIEIPSAFAFNAVAWPLKVVVP